MLPQTRSVALEQTICSEIESELSFNCKKRFPRCVKNISTVEISMDDPVIASAGSFMYVCQNLVNLIHTYPEAVFEKFENSFPTMATTIGDLYNRGNCTLSGISDYYTLPNGYLDTMTVEYVLDTLETAINDFDDDNHSDSEFSCYSADDDYDIAAVDRGSVFENIEMVRRGTACRDSLVTHASTSHINLYEYSTIPEEETSEAWIEPAKATSVIDQDISCSDLTITGAVQFKVITSDSSDAMFSEQDSEDDRFTSGSCYDQFCLADMAYLPAPPKLAVTRSGVRVEILQTASDEFEDIAMVKKQSGETALRTFDSLYVTQTSYVDSLYQIAEEKLQEGHDSELVELCMSTFKKLIEQEAYLKLVEFLGSEGRADNALVAGCVGKVMNDVDLDGAMKTVVISAMIELTQVAEIRRCLNGCMDMFSDCLELSGSYVTPFSPFSSCSC